MDAILKSELKKENEFFSKKTCNKVNLLIIFAPL
jgi:hypothetical protein